MNGDFSGCHTNATWRAASDFPFSDDDASLAIVAIISEIESRLAILEKDKVPKITAPTPTIADALK